MSAFSSYTDQMGRTVEIRFPPQRIISLVPSLTEYLCDLGLKDKLVGRTRFCIHPDGIKNITDIGGTKKLHIAKILALKPDLVLGNKEENLKDQVEELEKQLPVWMSDITTIEHSLEAMLEIGIICGKPEKAQEITGKLKASLTRIAANTYPFSGKTAAYFIWKNPWMVAGKNTFIDEVLTHCGILNIIREERYPEIVPATMKQADYILLSSEPYPFREKEIQELRNFFPNSHIMLVDGEVFSWYGSRMLHLEKYLDTL